VPRHDGPSQPGYLQGPAKRLTVYIGESDRYHHKPLYTEIVRRAHAAGLTGATVLRGIEGFGASNMVHTSRLLSLSEDLPVVIVIVDAAERIERFAAELDTLIGEGLVVIDDVQVVRHVGRAAGKQPDTSQDPA
jgi:PII-like signaling protein